MRAAAVFLVVGFFVLYAWRNWFRSCCFLVLMMAVLEHPDCPKNVMGIQGLNPWNILLVSVVLSWLFSRRRESNAWDLPRGIGLTILCQLTLVVVAFLRLWFDRSQLDLSTGRLVSEYLLNTIKWVVPGLLIFDGCRTRARLQGALFCVLGLYLLLALQVIRWMPWEILTGEGEALQKRGLKLARVIGYHRVILSTMFAGGAWAFLNARLLVKDGRLRFLFPVGFVLLTTAMLMTGGRMGCVSWVFTGLVLGLLRGPRHFFLVPVVLLVVVAGFPAVTERMLQGTGFGGEATDVSEVTSDRDLIWPNVVQKIRESPIVGYGRLAMIRTGLRSFWDEKFGHAHNAYLELLLDNGVIGLLLFVPFYVYVLFCALKMFRRSADPLDRAVGGAAGAIVMTFLVSSFGSHTFYPREECVPVWVAIFLLLRLRAGVQEKAPPGATDVNPCTLRMRNAGADLIGAR